MNNLGITLALCALLACSGERRNRRTGAGPASPASAADHIAAGNRDAGGRSPGTLDAPGAMHPAADAASGSRDASAAAGNDAPADSSAGDDREVAAGDLVDASATPIDCGPCVKLENRSYCQPGEVTWECRNTVPGQFFSAVQRNGCREAPTGLIRFCCLEAADIVCSDAGR